MQPPSDAKPPMDDLQFDRAEYAAGPASSAIAMCGVCHNTLRDRYFDINGKPACVACHQQVLASLNRGSRITRTLKALFLGFGAALIGAAIYFGIAFVTGYELGIVAIVLGLLVGVAVRVGSGGRGGWFYQIMAILLTYFAICAAYASMAVGEFMKDPQALQRALHRATSQPADQPGSGLQTDAASDVSTSQPAGAEHETSDSAPTSGPAAMTDKEWEQLSGGEKALAFVVGILALGFLFLSFPIYIATQNPVGFIIIGIGLWQAWATNKGAKLRISGPFAVAGAAPPTLPPDPRLGPPSLPPGSPHA